MDLLISVRLSEPPPPLRGEKVQRPRGCQRGIVEGVAVAALCADTELPPGESRALGLGELVRGLRHAQLGIARPSSSKKHRAVHWSLLSVLREDLDLRRGRLRRARFT